MWLAEVLPLILRVDDIVTGASEYQKERSWIATFAALNNTELDIIRLWNFDYVRVCSELVDLLRQNGHTLFCLHVKLASLRLEVKCFEPQSNACCYSTNHS
jgi:hypothetical protein